MFSYTSRIKYISKTFQYNHKIYPQNPNKQPINSKKNHTNQSIGHLPQLLILLFQLLNILILPPLLPHHTLNDTLLNLKLPDNLQMHKLKV